MSPTTPDQPPSPKPPQAGEVRAIRRLVASVGVSGIGTWSYNVGIAVYAYQQTGSTAWVAAATVGRYVPALLITWLGSRLVDSMPRRTVAVGADLVCAAAMVALTFVALAQGSIVLAIGLAALSSGVARIQSAAALSAAGDFVSESRLANTAALISTTDAVATAIGPAIAAVVLAYMSPAALFALNGATFALSALLLFGVTAIGMRVATAPNRASTTSTDDDGFAEVRRAVWPLLATRGLAAVVYGMDIVLLAILATDQLKQGTAGYGWLLAAAGGGGLLAALWLRKNDHNGRSTPRIVVGMSLYCLPFAAFMLAPDLLGSLATQVVRGTGCVIVTATVIAGLQRLVPARVSGRIFGLSNVIVMVGTSVGALMAPLLLSQLGTRTTVGLMAVLPVVALVALTPALLRFDREGQAVLASLDPQVNFLRGLTIFHDANRSTLYEVAESAETVEAVDGQTLVAQGDVSENLFVLLSGSASVYIDGSSGRRFVRTMTAPDYFGEIGIIHGVERTASVIADGPCTLWQIPGPVFLWAAGQAGLSGALTDTMTVRFDTTHSRPAR